MEVGDECVEVFSISDQSNDVSERFNMDRHDIVVVVEAFSS
jgi:hypothetical protein